MLPEKVEAEENSLFLESNFQRRDEVEMDRGYFTCLFVLCSQFL